MKFPAVRRVIESRNALEAERNMLKAERDLLRAELTAGRGAREKERSMLRAEGDKLDGHRAPINEIKASVGRASSVSSLSLKEALKDVSDESYFWLLTDGYNLDSLVKDLLPSMPAEDIQTHYTGHSGRATLKEAYLAYGIFKQLAASNSIDLRECDNILDFGCGWGRIIRFFLKDVEPSKLHGVDIDRAMIDICRQSHLKCSFSLIDPLPPLHFSDNMMDVIYLYSVFTHLSEEVHVEWLREFKRILRPGGVLIATTRPRAFIPFCAELRKKDFEKWQRGAASAFANTGRVLDAYDRGKYCHSATGGGVAQDRSFYGESCIPKTYVEKEWTKYFSFVDLISYPELTNYYQDVIVARK
jgi:SAM-dependent methyltransferase